MILVGHVLTDANDELPRYRLSTVPEFLIRSPWPSPVVTDWQSNRSNKTLGSLRLISQTNRPTSHTRFMQKLTTLYLRAVAILSSLRSPMVLAVRFYWGFQLAQTGWGKLHHIAKITDSFISLNIPFPGFNAHFVSGLEFVGGIPLMLGLASRLTSLLLASNMLVAYWTADREALTSIFSDPGRVYVADPYTFLFASVMVLIFGAGFFAIDTLLAKRPKASV
jgi:putative oxidoreductase